VPPGAEITPNHEFGSWRWVDAVELGELSSPLNVRELGWRALAARVQGG
jgi:hypothetical protein